MSNGISTFKLLNKHGRFGNQLFQIAAVIAHALDTGRDFIFPLWEYNKYMMHPLPVGDVPTIHYQYVPPFHYQAPPEYPPNTNVNWFSHMQSSRYFEHHADEIRYWFTPNDTVAHDATEHFNKMRLLSVWDKIYKRTCAIHIRRGDYNTPENRNYHGLLPLQYYEDGAKAIYGVDLADVLFYVYSDDPQWCQENFKLPNQVFSHGASEVTDFYSAALCDDFIIANSSYSWWFAWLSKSANKKVVCPKNWFQPAAKLDSKDVAVNGWVVI